MSDNDPFPPLGRRRFLQGAAALGGLAFTGNFLAACGGDDDGGTADTTASGATTATTGTSTGGSTAAGPSEGLIGLTLNGLNDYTKGVTTGVYKALEGTNYTLEVVQVNYDAAQELSAAEAFLAKGVVGLVIQPNTAESAGASAEKAFEQGVPAGNCIWPGPSDADQFFVGVAELGLRRRWPADRRVPHGQRHARQDLRRPGRRRPGILRAHRRGARRGPRRTPTSRSSSVSRPSSTGPRRWASSRRPSRRIPTSRSWSPTRRRCRTASPSG